MDSCLLCRTFIDPDTSLTSTTPTPLDRSARVIFLLRKLLNLAPALCEDLLRKYGHPGDWISLCSTCDDLVTQGTRLFDQITKLELEFDSVKERVQSVVRVKQEIREDGDHDDGMGDDESATSTIRRHLASNWSMGAEIDGMDISGEICPDFVMKVEQTEPEDEIPHLLNLPQLKRSQGKKSKRKKRFTTIRNKKLRNTTSGMGLHVGTHPPNVDSDLKLDLGDNERFNVLEKEIVLENIPSTINTQQKPQAPKRGRGRPRKQAEVVAEIRPLPSLKDSDSDEESDPEQEEDDHSDPDYSDQESLKPTSSSERASSPPPEIPLSWPEIIARFPPLLIQDDETLFPFQKRKLEFGRLQKLATKHGISSFPCSHCSKEMSTIPSWSSHVAFCSGQTTGYKCDTCEKVVRAKHTLENHVLSSHIPQDARSCRGCRIFYPDFDAHIKDNPYCEKYAIFCTHKPCKIALSSEQVYEIHVECRHGVANPYKCGVPGCGRRYGVKHKLKAHMEMWHSGRKGFVCDQCGKEFKVHDNLQSHLKTVHLSRAEGAPRFPCDVCGKEMISRTKLTRHKQIHIDPEDAPHLCTLCGKRYRLKEYLNIHMRSHDPDRREKYSHYMPKKNKKRADEVKTGVAGARIGRPKKKSTEIREFEDE